MDFEIKILTAAKKVWLMRQGTFFKEYSAMDIKLPPTVRIPSTRDGVALEVGSKSAAMEGKLVPAYSADFLLAEKRVILTKRGTSKSTSPTAVLVLRTQPVVKAIPVAQPASTSSSKSKKEPTAPILDDAPVVQTGVFLSAEDIEEIYPLLKRASLVSLVQ